MPEWQATSGRGHFAIFKCLTQPTCVFNPIAVAKLTFISNPRHKMESDIISYLRHCANKSEETAQLSLIFSDDCKILLHSQLPCPGKSTMRPTRLSGELATKLPIPMDKNSKPIALEDAKTTFQSKTNLKRISKHIHMMDMLL